MGGKRRSLRFLMGGEWGWHRWRRRRRGTQSSWLLSSISTLHPPFPQASNETPLQEKSSFYSSSSPYSSFSLSSSAPFFPLFFSSNVRPTLALGFPTKVFTLFFALCFSFHTHTHTQRQSTFPFSFLPKRPYWNS